MSEPKLTIVEPTPSQQAVAKAAAAIDVTDGRGRALTLRKPGVLAQYRLIEALGVTAKNETYVQMVMPLLYVSAIDGEAIVPPMTKREVEALIQRLDEEGITAVAIGVRDNFSAPDPEADQVTIKK